MARGGCVTRRPTRVQRRLEGTAPTARAGDTALGRVSDLHLGLSNRQAKLIAIDEQPEDDVMHLDRFGKADRLACQTLATGPQRQMLALDLLRVLLARVVLGLVKVTRVGAPIIGVIARDSKGREP